MWVTRGTCMEAGATGVQMLIASTQSNDVWAESCLSCTVHHPSAWSQRIQDIHFIFQNQNLKSKSMISWLTCSINNRNLTLNLTCTFYYTHTWNKIETNFHVLSLFFQPCLISAAVDKKYCAISNSIDKKRCAASSAILYTGS